MYLSSQVAMTHNMKSKLKNRKWWQENNYHEIHSCLERRRFMPKHIFKKMLLLIPLEKNNEMKWWYFGFSSNENKYWIIVCCTCYQISEFIHLERVICPVLYLVWELMYNNCNLFLCLYKSCKTCFSKYLVSSD